MRNDGYAARVLMILSGIFYARHRLEMNFVGKRNYLFSLGYYFKYMGGEPLIDLEE
jgi:hypothetical protein